MIITGTDKEAITKLRAGLVKRFKVDDTKWESLSSFLGINIIYNHRIGRMGFDVEQKVNKLFDDHKTLINVRSSDVPISDSDLEVPESAAADYNATDKYIVQHYASIVGACIYMSVMVRSDICYTAGKYSRGMHNPQPCHVAMLKHRVGYLKKTKVINISINETVMLLTTCFQISANRMAPYLLLQHQMVVISTLSSVCLMQILPTSMMTNASLSQGTPSLYSDAVSAGEAKCKQSPPARLTKPS